MTQLTDSDNRAVPDGSHVDPPDGPGAPPPEDTGIPPDGAGAPPDGAGGPPDPGIVSERPGAAASLDELRLAAEEAENEAVAAEAVAAAAQARARAIRLRRHAVAAANSATAVTFPKATAADAATASAVGADAPSGDSAADEHSAAATSPSRIRRLPSTRALVSAFAVALIAVSAAVSGLLIQHHRETVQANQHKVEFTEAARQGVVALTSLDFSRAEQDVQRVLEHSAGAFRDDFESRAPDFTSVIQQSQVATAGTVNSAAVESMTEDSAVVLVAATSQVTNSAGAQGEPRAWRLSVTVTREGDTIKMSKVEFVP